MQTTDEKKVYPTAPDAEGFYFKDTEDEEQAIFSKDYPNGNKIKKTNLPSSGLEAVVRELLGKDTKEITRHMDKDTERYQMAAITAATTIGGNKQTFEFFENMKLKDFNRLLSMYQDLNF